MRTSVDRAWAHLMVVAGAAALLMGCPSYSSMTTAKPVTLEGYPRSDGTSEMRIERVIVDGKTVELR